MDTASSVPVDFLLIGGTKAGTESIYHYFRQFPDAIAVRDKQQHYFCRGIFGPRYTGLETEIPTLQDYKSKAPPVRPGAKIGDFDCITLHGPNAASLVAEANPTPKIMVILRNPIARARSHYWMDVRECFESRPFERAIREDYQKYISGSDEYLPIIRLGFYTNQLKSFIHQFGQSNVRIWLYEDYSERPALVLKQMADFVGVDLPEPQPEDLIRVNEMGIPRSRLASILLQARHGRLKRFRPYYLKLPVGFRHFIRQTMLFKKTVAPPMEKEAEQLLIDAYREDILALEILLGRTLKSWLHSDTYMKTAPQADSASKVR
jgi:hypothetical protein